jgi:hypothetical protein
MVLAGGTGTLAALTIGGCGGDVTNASPPKPPTVGSAAEQASDRNLLRTAASLENLAVFAYGAALTRLQRRQMGVPPPIVLAFATQTRAHHLRHAQAINATLRRLGSPPYTQPDPAMLRSVQDGLPALGSIHDLATFSLILEEAIAQTHMRNLETLHDRGAIGVTAQIAPVEQQHVALLHITAGDYPVADSFTPTNQARPATDLT